MDNLLHNLEKSPVKDVRTVLVWDLFVRLFHWSLVILVLITGITGFLGEEWWLDYHVWAGYGIGGLILARLIWGLVGSPYARFSSFIFSRAETLRFFKELLRGRPSHYTGHNPAGALMVFALVFVLISITISGLIVLGGQENQGVLAGVVPYFVGEVFEEIHEVLSFLLLALIGGHIIGVFVESRLSGDNLVRSMVTGTKESASPDEFKHSKLKSAFVFLTVLAVIVGSGGWVYVALAELPPNGLIKMTVNKTYATECGDCHFAYHPSLLPANSWHKLMTGLEEHFGEDASLDKDVSKGLSDWLQKYASEKWDTEAANNLRQLDLKNLISITATPYWKKRHSEIAKAVFARKSIGSKGNCIACHKDARSGRFDDQQISIPLNQKEKEI